MRKFKVTFYPDNRQVEVSQGENLLRAAMAAEVHINASCGGDGTCGKCKVIVDKGKVEAQKSTKLSEKETKEGYALACLSTVQSDLEVRVPAESRLGRVPEERERPLSCGRIYSAAEKADRLRQWELDPAVKKLYLELSPPSLDDNASDASRIRLTLKGMGVDEARVSFDLPVLRHLASLLRQADWKVTVTLLDNGQEVKVTKVEAGDTLKKHYAVAVDLGTTTVVAKLIDLNKKEALAELSDYNGQVSCGEDVISRIVFSRKEGGLKRLQELAVQTINKLIGELEGEVGIGAHDIDALYVAGNTIMLHLLLGLDPKYIREEPYIPTASLFSWVRARDLGLEVSETAYLYPLPCVASYMGADVVAGLVAAGLTQEEKLSLYIDIGTNGEIVLGHRDWLISCSCSAGPAFEGGGVKHGMRATASAIEGVRIDPDTLEPMILTIGGRKPTGICGSGLIDTIAELFLARIIDQKGKIDLSLDTKRVRKGEGRPEYVLVWAEESGTGKDIVITEVDIDNLIRAKAAVYAGISILLESVEVSLPQVEEVLIAGAFGKYLEIEKAITIGLLPEMPCEKFVFVGNGSLWGAHMVSLSKGAKEEVEKAAQRMTYLDLSTNPKFMDGYVSALFLPHTHTELFPSVARQMAGGNQK